MSALKKAALAAALTMTLGAHPALAQRSLSIALSSNVNTLDPHNTASVGTDLSVISQLYSALLVRGPDMKLQPQLATSWKAVDDLTWRFTLRSGATFANGEALDADAVKWNIDRVLDPKGTARVKAWFELVDSVNAISPTELEIKMKKPHPAFVDQLSMFFLLPPKWMDTNKPANAAMSSGAYELSQYLPGDRFVLKARAGHWGEKPAFDTVTYRIIPDAGARVSALLAGEVDLITQVAPSEIKRIAASGKASAGSVDSSRTAFVKFNNLAAPLAGNVKFRQALNYAIDKVAIRDAILSGAGTISNCQVLSPDYFGYNPDLKPYPYDPAKARQLLKESGVSLAGTTLEFDMPTGVYLLGSEIVQAVAAQLEEVGVKTKITELEFGAFMNKYVRAPTMANLAYLTQAWPTLDADGLLTLFQAGNIYAYWPDQIFSDLLTQGRTTMDAAKRIEIYKKATERMCEEAPVLYLFSQPSTYGLSTRVNWKPRGDDWVRATEITAK